jgi:hypothetical protein
MNSHKLYLDFLDVGFTVFSFSFTEVPANPADSQKKQRKGTMAGDQRSDLEEHNTCHVETLTMER